MTGIYNGCASGNLEPLFEGEILRVPGFNLRKIRASDKWEKVYEDPSLFESLWNDKHYLDDSDGAVYGKPGIDNRTFSEIATEKTGLYRIIELDDYDRSMSRPELAEISSTGGLYCWIRFYGRMEIHGVIYGGTRTNVVITHVQKLYFRKQV